MDITLDKIELVKDRTGVSYREARNALEEANGSVVDAIIAIEEEINLSVASGRHVKGYEGIIDNIKAAVRKGNMARIIIKNGDVTLINLPLTVSIAGAVLAPWAVIIGTVAAAGANCRIEFINDRGQSTDINGKIKTGYDKAKYHGRKVMDIGQKKFDELKDKEKYGEVISKGEDALRNLKDRGEDFVNDVKNIDNLKEIKEKGKSLFQRKHIREAGDEVQEMKDEFHESVDDVVDEIAKENGLG